jgi:hypothetical protein
MPVFVRKSVPWKACAAALIGLALLAPPLPKSTCPGHEAPKDVRIPNDTPVAIYLPANDLGTRFYVSTIGAWAYPGKSLDDARSAVGGQLFPQMQPVNLTDSGAFADGTYGLLIAINPTWNIAAGQLSLTRLQGLRCRAKKLLEGSQVQSVGLHSSGPPAASECGVAHHATGAGRRAGQGQTQRAAFPATAQMPPSTANCSSTVKAVNTGTAFYINKKDR